MKNIFIALSIFLGASLTVKAQKIGHVNSLEVLEKLPERLKIDEELKSQGATLTAEIEKMAKAFQDKVALYEKEAAKQTAENNAKKAQELQQEQTKLQEHQANVSKEFQDKREEKYKPIFDKVQNAINKVALAKSLAYVIDSSQTGVLVYANPSLANDITNDVKTELGVK